MRNASGLWPHRIGDWTEEEVRGLKQHLQDWKENGDLLDAACMSLWECTEDQIHTKYPYKLQHLKKSVQLPAIPGKPQGRAKLIKYLMAESTASLDVQGRGNKEKWRDPLPD